MFETSHHLTILYIIFNSIEMDVITIKLKKMLLSRNIVFQDKSIQFMIRSLKDPKKFNLVSRTYLDADMIQFLCEPLLSINTPLIKSICLCVWMLSKNDTFYKRNDVLYTCNSLLRTLVFLIRTSDALVSDLIQLLAIIIKKGGTNLQEVCNIPQVLIIIKMVFTNSQNLPAHCVINAISILTYFLSCPSIELCNKLYNTSMSISKAICKSVTGKCIIDSRVVDIASNLSSSLLRLYSTITKRVLLNENLKKHTEIAKLLKNVAWYMIKHISLPFFLKHLNINIYYKSYRKAIKNLISPFKESLSTSARQNIASHYAASRIIRNLYELIEYNKIGILAEELLFEMLFYLSSAYLEINHHWPGGIDMFRNQMVWSFKNFPKTPKDLCFVLTNSTNTDIRHSIIIFIYFYLLTCSNDEKESIYLEPMCDYLCSIQNDIPIPVIKAILFNISICFVSHHAVNSISGLEFATKKLVELINSKIIDSIFTHHPALLYFLFASSIIPEKIQLQLIKQWVQNSDEISLVELEKFCLNNHKAKLCLMDVLINDTNIDNNKLHSGFNIVKKIITTENECNEHKTLLIIWDMLPIYLGSFCCTNNSKGIGATNLTFLLNLTEPCSLRGTNISINEHRSIVYTMSSIIKIHQSTFNEQYSLLSSLLQHLITLIQFSNSDVLNTIKKNKNFLYALENLCLSKNNNICFLAINTVIQLCQLEQEETNMEHKLLYSITLKCEYILNAMTRLCQNCKISSITLFKIILKYYEEGICKSVEFTEAPSVDFLKTIFMQLKTIISQELDWVSDQAWECITIILSTKLLKHLQELTYLKIEFATDPWLNFILVNSKSFSEKCLEFLYIWLKHFVTNDENNFTIRGSKVLCPSLFDSTIVHISVTLVNQVYERSELISKAKFIIQLILENKFSLPNELEGKMNVFLN